MGEDCTHPLDGLSTTIDNSDVASINSRGWIAGNSATGDIDPITGGQIVHAVLWKENKAIDLGTLGSGLESTASYVNDGGVVVGFSTINTIPEPQAKIPLSFHHEPPKESIGLRFVNGVLLDSAPGHMLVSDARFHDSSRQLNWDTTTLAGTAHIQL